ncbi:cytochrome o ubiquinol oxidase subunit III [Celeribacter indicus]|uniref:Cytochrome bo(3) ubiquinol oxidase subunit 3 n=1 Tax=Celeribacter indicus TaxID=1208324 RepID=A0A0B5E3U5_9RHOB|nr:cytochrome o ubiquinol oxidase subunit III [Celeribacter indicus]AJE48045.1 cytochrome o ubiquinol oxidase subunit III (Ubiquinol oxidase chain C) [Celeribacter indicus]SDW30449.1 cytochrome o ubiquinol oxidase subunit 3 [Celeribacter indicus]
MTTTEFDTDIDFPPENPVPHVRGRDPEEFDHGPHVSPTPIGFWIYLMSDCIIFGALFATYAVLGGNYAGGPAPKDLFEAGFVAVETALLLASSITFGLAMLAADKGKRETTLKWLAVTGLLGAGFIGMELYEFNHLIHIGAGPDRSAFLSAFFALVGTHGLHVTGGLIWLMTLMVQLAQRGLTTENMRRLGTLSMFWHFLDLVWIGVFSFVYLVRLI